MNGSAGLGRRAEGFLGRVPPWARWTADLLTGGVVFVFVTLVLLRLTGDWSLVLVAGVPLWAAVELYLTLRAVFSSKNIAKRSASEAFGGTVRYLVARGKGNSHKDSLKSAGMWAALKDLGDPEKLFPKRERTKARHAATVAASPLVAIVCSVFAPLWLLALPVAVANLALMAATMVGRYRDRSGERPSVSEGEKR